MTHDRAEALAFIEHLMAVGCFHVPDMKDLLSKADSIRTKFEFEGAMEISNETSPTVTSSMPANPAPKKTEPTNDEPPPWEKDTFTGTLPKADEKPKTDDLDF